MTPERLRGIPALLTVLALAAGCESSGTLAPGDLAIAVAPAELSFVAGTDSAVTVTVVRGGSYQGPVTLGAQGMPEGVTVRSGILSAVENVGVIWFVADSSAAGTGASVTVTATADGLEGEATAQLALTIETPPPPSFSIAVERDTATLAVGVPDTVAVAITREHGFADRVAFAVTGMPEGLAAAFVEDTVPGDMARLALEADSTVATDTTFLLAITASAEGFEDRIDTLAVVVAAPPPPSFAIAVERDTVTLTVNTPDTVAVAITREHGFADTVAFTVAGMPEGLSAAFVEDTVAGDTARLALDADSTVATDTTFLLAITASAEGFEDRIEPLAVVVAAPAAPAPLRLRIDRRPSPPDRSRGGRSTISSPGGS